jgi:hypothetical protein
MKSDSILGGGKKDLNQVFGSRGATLRRDYGKFKENKI